MLRRCAHARDALQTSTNARATLRSATSARRASTTSRARPARAIRVARETAKSVEVKRFEQGFPRTSLGFLLKTDPRLRIKGVLSFSPTSYGRLVKMEWEVFSITAMCF